jgi:hypothetical protein
MIGNRPNQYQNQQTSKSKWREIQLSMSYTLLSTNRFFAGYCFAINNPLSSIAFRKCHFLESNEVDPSLSHCPQLGEMLIHG